MPTRTDYTPNPAGPHAWIKLTDGATWTDMPSAVTEFAGATSGRVRADLRGFKYARLSANVGATAGGTGSVLQVQYSIDSGSNWLYLDGLLTTSGGPAAPIATTASTLTAGWVAIAAGAKVDQVLLRLVGLTGDGTIDPVLGAAFLELSA